MKILFAYNRLTSPFYLRKNLYILFLVVCSIHKNINLTAQNFISNPGFEYHKTPAQKAWFRDRGEFEQVVSNWTTLSYGHETTLFTTRYSPQKSEMEAGYNFDKCKPYSGNSMMQIWILPKGGPCNRGAGGYISTKLAKSLEAGGVYELSYMIYILPSNGTHYKPDFIKQFGIHFSDTAVQVANPECMLLSDSPFRVDTARISSWFQVKHYIKPSKTLSYITLGAF
jgi:hypothetical protein